MLEIGLLVLGLIGLWFGSDILVSGAKSIARSFHLSEVIIGLTIVSIGTSVPEIATNVMAGHNIAQGLEASGIAVGNIVGSCLGQITLILGLVGLAATLRITKRSLRRDGLMMILAVFFMFAVSLDMYVSRVEGLFLAVVYLFYMLYLIAQEKRTVEFKAKKGRFHIKYLMYIVAGVAAVVYSADIVVKNGILIAQSFGIKETIIGIFVGLSTSLPELSVSIKAAMRHAGGISIGNLLGSNITDPLLSFGAGAAVAGFAVPAQVLRFDFPFWIVASVIALLLLYNHTNLNRKESGVLIIFYALFMYLQFML